MCPGLHQDPWVPDGVGADPRHRSCPPAHLRPAEDPDAVVVGDQHLHWLARSLAARRPARRADCDRRGLGAHARTAGGCGYGPWAAAAPEAATACCPFTAAGWPGLLWRPILPHAMRTARLPTPERSGGAEPPTGHIVPWPFARTRPSRPRSTPLRSLPWCPVRPRRSEARESITAPRADLEVIRMFAWDRRGRTAPGTCRRPPPVTACWLLMLRPSPRRPRDTFSGPRALPAPPRVAPAPSPEQEQHEQHDQHGCHGPHLPLTSSRCCAAPPHAMDAPFPDCYTSPSPVVGRGGRSLLT
jgi:hypothetical protein